MKKNWRRGSAATSIAGIVLVAASGCGSNGGGETGGEDSIVVGYAGYTVANPFFAGIQLGLERGAKKEGYELKTTNANGDAAQQFTDVQNLLSQGVDVLIITPIDAKANAPAVKAADAQGVPVISLADTIADAPVTTTLAQNHYDAARLAGEFLISQLEQKNGSPEGNVVNIQGLAGVPATTPRSDGFTDVIGEYPEINVVATADGGYDTEKANAVMTDILQANPDIDAVYTANDAEAVGVTAAIKQAGRFEPVGQPGHIIVVGIDGPAPAIQAIRDGEQDGTISQNPVAMAEDAVSLIPDILAGKEVEDMIEWPSQLITQDNIDSDEVKKYGIWGDEVG